MSKKPIKRVNYKVEFCKAIIDYFTANSGDPDNVKHLSDFAETIGVKANTVTKWCGVHAEFLSAFNQVRDMMTGEGRPTKYKEEYCKAIIDYFDIKPLDDDGKPVDPKFVSAFARSIGVCHDTLHEWCQRHPKFSEAFQHAREMQKQFFITQALQNRYNSSFTWKAMMNMFGWKEKSDNIVTGKEGGAVEITGIEIVLKSPTQKSKNG